MPDNPLVSPDTGRRYSSIALIILLFSVTFLNDPGLPDSFFTFKEFWFLMAIGLAIIAGSLLVPFVKCQVTYIDGAVLLYILYSSLNSFIKSVDFLVFLSQFLTNLGLLALYFFIKEISKRGHLPKTHWIYLFFLLLGIQVLIGLTQCIDLQYAEYSQFIKGMFFNAGPYSIFLAALVPLVFFSLLHQRKLITILPFSIILILAVIIIGCSQSRTAWISLISSSSIAIILKTKNYFLPLFNQKRGIKILIFSLLFISLITAISYYLYNLKRDSSLGRQLTYSVGFRIINNYPLTGVGAPNYAVNNLKFQGQFFDEPSGPNFERYKTLAGDVRFTFNDYLQILCEEGILGLLLFGLILLSLIRILRQHVNSHQNHFLLSCYLSILSILLASFFSYPLHVLEIKILFYSLIGIISGSAINYDANESGKYKSFKSIFFAIGCVFILYGGSRWYALVNVDKAIGVKAVESYYPLLGDKAPYLLYLADLYIKNQRYDLAVPILIKVQMITPEKNSYYMLGHAYEKLKKYGMAEKQYAAIEKSIPNLIVPKYLLVKLYYSTKNYSLFEAKAKSVLNMQVKIKSILTDRLQGEVSMLLQNYKKSVEQNK